MRQPAKFQQNYSMQGRVIDHLPNFLLRFFAGGDFCRLVVATSIAPT